jgi:ketosteroid isomerase-like protein
MEAVMSQTTTEQFIEALHALERDRDLETIVGLFAPESEVSNITALRTFSGAEGAREFWQAYRDTFGEIESSFHNVIDGDDRAALEWTSTGTSVHGAPITYSGVSILEMADGQITRFQAYFDPGDLGRQIEQSAR